MIKIIAKVGLTIFVFVGMTITNSVFAKPVGTKKNSRTTSKGGRKVPWEQ